MQTTFTTAQLADPDIATAEPILRKCVHCGFCTATCPTYVLLGDELDSPRGRIYLIKDMLENDRPATKRVVQHIDRCLSCLACMTTCPSGVHYQHLIDLARAHVERTYRRSWFDRGLRAMLAYVLPNPNRFRQALRLARFAKPFGPWLPKQVRAMLALAPYRLPAVATSGQPVATSSRHKRRVALLGGCVQSIVGPEINAATKRLFGRIGLDVVEFPGCCGSIVHHLGRDEHGKALAAPLIEQIYAEHKARRFDAIIVNASGCGTHFKDYRHIFRNDTNVVVKAAMVSALTRDVAEFLAECQLPHAVIAPGLVVAYHSACSMQHGQKIDQAPRDLLARVGFAVANIPEGHLCCGSAGTYNILQPDLASRLRDRKLANIERTGAEVVATGNIGCIAQLAGASRIPVVHTVELIDWATGGPRPATM